MSAALESQAYGLLTDDVNKTRKCELTSIMVLELLQVAREEFLLARQECLASLPLVQAFELFSQLST